MFSDRRKLYETNTLKNPYTAISNNKIEEIKTVAEKKRYRVAIYCRLSQEDRNKKNKEDESESIKNQKIMLTEYANSNEDWDIVGTFVDEDWAGMNQDRPNYNKVLELAERGEVDIVLCKSLNRFTRDSIVVEQYVLEKFKEWNVRFIGLVDNTDTALKGNRKSIQINGLTNQWTNKSVVH